MTERLHALPVRLARLIGSPGALFEALAANPAWLGALVLGAVLGAGTGLATPTELYEMGACWWVR
jgi:hypothetical protein